MKIQMIQDENLSDIFARIDSTLSNVEVKGDSVALLFNTRMMLKELFRKIQEKEVEEEKEA